MSVTESMLLAGLGATWGGIGLSFAIGRWARARESEGPQLAEQFKSVTASLLYRIEQLERRTDQAGNKMSDLASAVQGLPEELRRAFVTREEWDMSERRRA